MWGCNKVKTGINQISINSENYQIWYENCTDNDKEQKLWPTNSTLKE